MSNFRLFCIGAINGGGIMLAISNQFGVPIALAADTDRVAIMLLVCGMAAVTIWGDRR